MKNLSVTKVNRMQKAAVFCIAMTMFPLCAFATNEGINATEMFADIIATACQVFQLLGAFLMVYALGSLFMAFRDENAESKSKAGMYLLVSILLISVPGIFNAAIGDSIGVQDGTSLLDTTTN